MGPFGFTDPRLSTVKMLGMGPALPGPIGPQQMAPGFRPPSAPLVQPPQQQQQGMGLADGMGMLGMGLGMNRTGDYSRPPTPVSAMPTIPAAATSTGGAGPVEPILAANGTVGTANPGNGLFGWLRGLF